METLREIGFIVLTAIIGGAILMILGVVARVVWAIIDFGWELLG